MKRLLFTDLDGTLLDHHNYDYTPAKPALTKLDQLSIPCILTTSKTFSEVSELKAELNNDSPFIVENGAGIFWPSTMMASQFLPEHIQPQRSESGFDFISLSDVSLAQILELASSYRSQLNLDFIGFSEMSVEDVVDVTGLPLDKAEQAKTRHFSEPLLWRDSDQKLTEFQQLLAAHNLQLIKGGRFVHLMGRADKGQALLLLKAFYQCLWQSEVNTMALGDGYNDVPLLEASDNPVIISSPVNDLPVVNHPHVSVSKHHGPLGWNQAVLEWLEH